MEPHVWKAIGIIGGGGIAPFAILSQLKFQIPDPWELIFIAAIILPTTIWGAWVYIAGERTKLR